MNRELKFRGHTGKFWVHGNLILGNVKGSELTHIEHTDFDEFRKWDVVRESVGQYTGLKDKNGKEIYEGDVVRLTNPKAQVQKKSIISQIGFLDGAFCALWRKTEEWEGYNVSPSSVVFLNAVESKFIEIIGNLYETPELLTKDLQSSNR